MTTTTFFLLGEIDLASCTEVTHSLRQWRQASVASRWVADCSGVTFMDAAGYTVLEALAAEVRQEGHRFEIARPSRPVRRLLEMIDGGLARTAEV
jgi:anti-anti-sigma factor